jgi:hypothetical protein
MTIAQTRLLPRINDKTTKLPLLCAILPSASLAGLRTQTNGWQWRSHAVVGKPFPMNIAASSLWTARCNQYADGVVFGATLHYSDFHLLLPTADRGTSFLHAGSDGNSYGPLHETLFLLSSLIFHYYNSFPTTYFHKISPPNSPPLPILTLSQQIIPLNPPPTNFPFS